MSKHFLNFDNSSGHSVVFLYYLFLSYLFALWMPVAKWLPASKLLTPVHDGTKTMCSRSCIQLPKQWSRKMELQRKLNVLYHFYKTVRQVWSLKKILKVERGGLKTLYAACKKYKVVSRSPCGQTREQDGSGIGQKWKSTPMSPSNRDIVTVLMVGALSSLQLSSYSY